MHFYRNVFSKAPKQKRALAAKMPKAIRAQEPEEADVAKAGEAAAGLGGMRLGAAARVVREGRLEALAYTDFPMRRWTRIRTNNAIERLNREIRRRTRVVGTFLRRPFRLDAGDRQAQVHRRVRVGQAPLSGCVASRERGGWAPGRSRPGAGPVAT